MKLQHNCISKTPPGIIASACFAALTISTILLHILYKISATVKKYEDRVAIISVYNITIRYCIKETPYKMPCTVE